MLLFRLFSDTLVILIIYIFPVNADYDGVTLDPKTASYYGLGSQFVGVQSATDHFPHNVQFVNLDVLCGGTILNSWAVLTAAHCFDINRSTIFMKVISGAVTLLDELADKYKVDHYILHQNYIFEKTFDHDIALVFINKPFKFGERVQRALIVNHLVWMNTQENFLVVGWGYLNETINTGTSVLLRAHVSIVNNEKCGVMYNDTFTSSKFCLHGDWDSRTCFADSGGTATWNGFIVGVISQGSFCGRKDKAVILTNVFYFTHWIETKIKGYFNKYCKPPRRLKGPHFVPRNNRNIGGYMKKLLRKSNSSPIASAQS